MEEKATVVFLVGLPGTGKSTCTRLILNGRDDFIIVSTDSIIEQFAEEEGKTYSEVFTDKIKEATKIFNSEIDYLTKENKNVVIDRTNTTVKGRHALLQRFKNYYKMAVVFNTPEPKEHQRRLDSRPGKFIPPHVIESMKNGFEYPSYDEGFDEITEMNDNWLEELQNGSCND